MHLGAKCSKINCYLQRIFFNFIDSVQKFGLGVIHRGDAIKGVKARIKWNKESGGEAAGSNVNLNGKLTADASTECSMPYSG